MGLTEAPRGALGHWLTIKDHKIGNYQCVVPTTWNCSPKDDRGNPGALEKELLDTPIADSDNPIEATRVVRSFDPCIGCASEEFAIKSSFSFYRKSDNNT